MFLAERLKKIKPSPTLAITQKAAELKAAGEDVISLGAGEPDFDTPEPIKEAAIKAIRDGCTKYTAVDGMPALKKAIQRKFLKENKISYETDEITVGCGAKHVLYNALMATLNPGDEVIIPSPYWVSYLDMVFLAEGVPVIVPCLGDTHFKLDPEVLKTKITPYTKWLILNSPSNPSGSVYSKEELEKIAEVIRPYPHLYVLSDDIYEHILYEGKFYTLAQIAPDLKNRILTVNGVSKSFSMTGWRIGYAGGPKPLIKAMAMLQSQSTTNPSSISQMAAIAGLEGNLDFLQERNKVFQERRDFLVREINQIPGLECDTPKGAFYLYISCKGLLKRKTSKGYSLESDQDVATYLLEEGKLAVVPGSAFGLSPYFRISYATDMETLKKACKRLKEACSQLA